MHELDVQGLSCPLPILRTKKALKTVAAGETLKVVATDPGSVKDMATFCQQTGNRLVDSREDNGVYTFIIERAAG